MNTLFTLPLLAVMQGMILYIPKLWKRRQPLAALTGGLLALTTCATIFSYSNTFTILLGLVTIFHLINLLRIIHGRLHEQRLLRTSRKTFWHLSAYQVVIVVLWGLYAGGWLPVSLALLLTSMVLIAALILLTVAVSLLRSQVRYPAHYLTDKELPTLTVAIPARNETAGLHECLESVLASDYPKLEVIVLDDNSSDNTGEIIKGFAQAGVRFIQGDNPLAGWLAKNQAYDALLGAASGELVLFCGVDVRFKPDTVRKLVARMVAGGESMVSLLPKRSGISVFSFVIQPMRYWWELALPRYLMEQPAALSTCWMVTKKALKAKGGFGAIPHNIRPEAFFAREFRKDNKYSFLLAGSDMGLCSTKRATDQFETSVRVRYPEVHYRPERVLLLMMFELVFLFGPFLALLTAMISGSSQAVALSLVASILLLLAHLCIIVSTLPAKAWFTFLNLPLVVLVEMWLINESMMRYEFGVVEWRGRDITATDLETIPHLPKLT